MADLVIRHRNMMEKLGPERPPPSGETDRQKFKLFEKRALPSLNQPHHVEVTIRLKHTYIAQKRREYLNFTADPKNQFQEPSLPHNW